MPRWVWIRTVSFEAVNCSEPSHHDTRGAGRDPRTSHRKSYDCFVDMNFKSCIILTVKGRTVARCTRREKMEIDRTKLIKLVSMSSWSWVSIKDVEKRLKWQENVTKLNGNCEAFFASCHVCFWSRFRVAVNDIKLRMSV